LRVDGAEEIASRSFLAEDFLLKNASGLKFSERAEHMVVHPHCHSRALGGASAAPALLRSLPSRTVTVLDSSCCGMAGAFGALEKSYGLSMQLGSALAEKIKAQPASSALVACGTSCRQQIERVAGAKPKHVVEVLADALA
jgi:Fe-S oxidoreductase